jgi:hypothetical protein
LIDSISFLGYTDVSLVLQIDRIMEAKKRGAIRSQRKINNGANRGALAETKRRIFIKTLLNDYKLSKAIVYRFWARI